MIPRSLPNKVRQLIYLCVYEEPDCREIVDAQENKASELHDRSAV